MHNDAEDRNSSRKRPRLVKIPRRTPSIVIPEKPIIYITPDKTTCKDCTCFPKEDLYKTPKKLNPCQKSPLTLYELSAKVIENLPFPEPSKWSIEDVMHWMEHTVELPQYKNCISHNFINGLRLLMLEDPSKLALINIHDFEHIQRITLEVRKLYCLDFIRFSRSIGLPPRRPLVHCTWFKSRTGPSWGIRENWSRCDVLRWMKILDPEPVYLNHWDLVWYMKPDFPRTKFARIRPNPPSQVHIPHYKEPKDVCYEYEAPRKFRIQSGIPECNQKIWMEHNPLYIKQLKDEERKAQKAIKKKNQVKFLIKEDSTLLPKKINLEGLRGKDLILARRLMPKTKFIAF